MQFLDKISQNALNRALILAQECRGKMVQNRTGIMDLQNKNNILVAKQVSYRILVPMLYIICREHTCIHPWGWHLHGFRAAGGECFFLIFLLFLYNLQSPITAKENKIHSSAKSAGRGDPHRYIHACFPYTSYYYYHHYYYTALISNSAYKAFVR